MTAPRQARKPPWIPILSVLIALVAVGVGAWVVSQRHGDRIVSETITREAPELGQGAHLLLPDLDKAVVTVPDRPHDPSEVRAADRFERITRLRSFEVSTNSQGFRGPEVGQKAGFRIVCLGDSVTFGWGVTHAQSYPARLGEALGVEVINTGVPAMKPSSMAAFASTALAELQPDLVLFTRRPNHMSPDPYRDFLTAVQQVRKAAPDTALAVVMPPVSTFDPMGSQIYEKEAKRVADMVRPVPVLDLTPAFRAALPLPGIVMETDGQSQRVFQLPGRTRLLEVAAPAHGLAPEIVSLFEDDTTMAEPLFFDGGHPDDPGFVVFVDALVPWLREQGLVD